MGRPLWEEGALTGYLAQLSEMTGETVPALAEEIMAMLTGFEGLADGSDMLAASAESVKESLEGIAQEQRTAGKAPRITPTPWPRWRPS